MLNIAVLGLFYQIFYIRNVFHPLTYHVTVHIIVSGPSRYYAGN
jgi:hypothetical protein